MGTRVGHYSLSGVMGSLRLRYLFWVLLFFPLMWDLHNITFTIFNILSTIISMLYIKSPELILSYNWILFVPFDKNYPFWCEQFNSSVTFSTVTTLYTHNLCLVKTFSSPPKKSHTTSQCQHAFFLWIHLFGLFRINGNIQYVTFCAWFFHMFLRFIRVAACISTAFLFMTE